MGEVKSVKVDNWGVFFLQKLQNFFNKTDYCDLTLQFRDNSQLKVHRLVLSACTDYFNVLEQTCDIIDDALIMPAEFQADVVVPIVNFMYTGTLEFELKMYGKLLRTAKEMNMTVLLKLLEAHRRTMENVNRQQRPPSPKGIRRRPMVPSSNAMASQQRVSISTPQSRMGSSPGNSNTVRSSSQQPRGINTPAILRSGGNRNQYGESSSTPSYAKQEPTSPFEQLRKGYNNNKRPAQTSLLSPPSKKPSLEEVKEFAEQQRMRKQIAAEYGDHGDPEYDSMMLYDDVHTGDDDDDDLPPQPSTSKQQQQTQQQAQQSGTQTQMEHGTTTIILKQDSPSQTPTIIVKDSSNTKLNHTKIIAEVLRQYPHIVKGHKNIKLKIMPNSPVEKAATTVKRSSPAPATIGSSASVTSPHKKLHVSFKPDKPMITTQQQKSIQKTTTPQNTSSGDTATQAAGTASTAAASTAQKRRIDSKTMHALIALGAENTTGPWLCLRCGVNGRPISIPSYRGFRRHLINTHKETIDPALCEHCGWRSSNNRELHFHMYTEHQIKSLLYNFAECALCNQTYLTKNELEQHINEAHTDENKQQCIYCNKVFGQELQLYRHMKSYHKAQALEDGIIDETDEEYLGSQDEDEQMEDEEQDDEEMEEEPLQDEKVRILSDISLPATSAIVKQQSRDEQDDGGIEPDTEEEQLHSPSEEQEVKFVGADGNEVELTDEQRKEILSQLNQQQAGATSGGVVMVLSEPEVDGKQEGDSKSLAGTEEEEYDDSQIYSELAAAGSVESSSKKSEAADESKESIDNLEWAENLLSKHDLETEQNNKEPKADKGRDDISEKLKELTGDWTEDENEDDEEADDKPARTEVAANVQSGAVTETQVESEKATGEPAGEDPEPEDDIDLALESLHKGDGDGIEAVGKEARAAATSSTKETILNEPDAVTKATEDVLKKSIEQVVELKKEECEPLEEFIKEDASTTVEAVAMPATENTTETNENATENSGQPNASAGIDDVHLETENIRKVLIDELIAEAEAPDLDTDADTMDQVEDAAEVSSQLAAADASEVLQIGETKPVEDEDKSAENNNEDRPEESTSTTTLTTTTLTTTTTSAAESSETLAEKPVASDAMDADENAETLTGTQEKLKSLMKEWGDEEEEEVEDENGVSATAKEQL